MDTARLRAVLAAIALTSALLGGWASPAAAQRSEADVDVAQAILAYEDRRYDEALAFLRQALAVDPDSVDALYYTGLTLIAQGGSREAVAPLERARRLAPEDTAIAYQLGLAYFTLRDHGRAEPLLTEVLRREPRADGIGYYVGFLRYQRRDYASALDALGTGGSSDPALQQLTRLYRGLALAALGRAGEAVAEVDAAARMPGGAALTGPAERFREGLRSAQDRSRRLRVEARVGVLFDTNASVLPEPSHDFTAEQARRERDRHTLGEPHHPASHRHRARRTERREEIGAIRDVADGQRHHEGLGDEQVPSVWAPAANSAASRSTIVGASVLTYSATNAPNTARSGAAARTRAIHAPPCTKSCTR